MRSKALERRVRQYIMVNARSGNRPPVRPGPALACRIASGDARVFARRELGAIAHDDGNNDAKDAERRAKDLDDEHLDEETRVLRVREHAAAARHADADAAEVSAERVRASMNAREAEGNGGALATVARTQRSSRARPRSQKRG